MAILNFWIENNFYSILFTLESALSGSVGAVRENLRKPATCSGGQAPPAPPDGQVPLKPLLLRDKEPSWALPSCFELSPSARGLAEAI